MRICLILLVTVAAATGYFVVERVLKAQNERELIFNGRKVTAKLETIEGSTVAGRAFSRKDSLPVTLVFPAANGAGLVRVDGRLAGGVDGMARIGDEIEIRVDPNESQRWTDRTVPRPWTAELTVVYGLAPLLVLLAAAVLISRARVLSVWRHGQSTLATVIDAKQSSIAPLSRIVRFVLADGEDKRVYSTLCPADAVPPAGESIALIMPSGRPSRAIVAELYAG